MYIKKMKIHVKSSIFYAFMLYGMMYMEDEGGVSKIPVSLRNRFASLTNKG